MRSNSTTDVYKNREQYLDARLPESAMFAVRLDGRAFHTFTRHFVKPFDIRIDKAMVAATKEAFSAMGQCVVAYTQSDEISLIYAYTADDAKPFSLRIQKIVSTLASAATAGFVSQLMTFFDLPSYANLPTFDGRVFLLTGTDDAMRYLSWRRSEAIANAISSAATAAFGHSALVGKSDGERRRMLEAAGLDCLIDPRDLYGAVVAREEWRGDITWRGRDGVERTAPDVVRHRIVAKPAQDKELFLSALLGTW